jgi:hypothetical protein
MKKAIPVIPKKRGRPATGRDPVLSLRIPADMLGAIERCAAELGASRSWTIRTLLAAGISAFTESDAAERRTRMKTSAPDHVREAADRAEAMGEARRRPERKARQ